MNEAESVRIAVWRRVTGLTIGLVFLTTVAVILAFDVARFGLDGWNGYLVAVWVLFTVVFIFGLVPNPPRWRGARMLILFLAFANLVLLYYYVTAPLHADHALALCCANFCLTYVGGPTALSIVRSKPRVGREVTSQGSQTAPGASLPASASGGESGVAPGSASPQVSGTPDWLRHEPARRFHDGRGPLQLELQEVNEAEPVRIAVWRRVAGLTIGLVFLTITAVVLAFDVARFGLDGWNGYLVAVWVLFTVVFISGLVPDPPRWRGARRLILFLAFANLVLNYFYLLAPSLHIDHASALYGANFSLSLAGGPAALSIVKSKPRAPRARPTPLRRTGPLMTDGTAPTEATRGERD